MTDFTPEDYIKYRIDRANETIKEVQVHIDNRFWNTAINRMYYACFYYDEETVLRLYPISQRFIAEITNILDS